MYRGKTDFLFGGIIGGLIYNSDKSTEIPGILLSGPGIGLVIFMFVDELLCELVSF